jgi:hypothetical protein
MGNSITLFDNQSECLMPSAFIEKIVYETDTQNIAVTIRKKNGYQTYVYKKNNTPLPLLLDAIQTYGAGRAYNWFIKTKNFEKRQS